MTTTIVSNDNLPIFFQGYLIQTDTLSASNYDDSLVKVSNRGQKLKRRAEFIHEGQLGGRKVYKRVCLSTYNKKLVSTYRIFFNYYQKVEHAGYYRFILRRNPKRFDEYGDELEDDEADERVNAEAAEGNPYGYVKLEGEMYSIEPPLRRLLTLGI